MAYGQEFNGVPFSTPTVKPVGQTKTSPAALANALKFGAGNSLEYFLDPATGALQRIQTLPGLTGGDATGAGAYGQRLAPISTTTDLGKLWTASTGDPIKDAFFNQENFGKVVSRKDDQGYQMNVGSLTPEQKAAFGLEGVDNSYGIKFTDFSKPDWGIKVSKKQAGGEGLGGILQTGVQGLKSLGQGIIDDPTRLLTGVDPASTKLWNAVLGTDKDALVTQMGGPGKQAMAESGASDSTKGFYKFADKAAAMIGGAALAGSLANAGGGGASNTSGIIEGGNLNPYSDLVSQGLADSAASGGIIQGGNLGAYSDLVSQGLADSAASSGALGGYTGGGAGSAGAEALGSGAAEAAAPYVPYSDAVSQGIVDKVGVGTGGELSLMDKIIAGLKDPNRLAGLLSTAKKLGGASGGSDGGGSNALSNALRYGDTGGGGGAYLNPGPTFAPWFDPNANRRRG